MTKKTKKPLMAKDEIIARVGDYCIAGNDVYVITKADKGDYPPPYKLVPVRENCCDTTCVYNLIADYLFNKFGFFMIITKTEAMRVKKMSIDEYDDYIDAAIDDCDLKGYVFGNPVRKVGDFYVFGCGRIVLTASEIEEVLRVKKQSASLIYSEIAVYLEDDIDLNDESYSSILSEVKSLGFKS